MAASSRPKGATLSSCGKLRMSARTSRIRSTSSAIVAVEPGDSRRRDACSKAGPFTCRDVLADPEYTFARSQKLAAIAPCSAFRCCAKERRSASSILTRTEVRPFTDKQIELVTTFADQAVIAIENVRLFDEVQARTRELTEALEQQTATSEVLQVICSSPGELEPVFQAMLENATRICEAKFGILFLLRRRCFRVARCTARRRICELWRREPVIDLRPSTRPSAASPQRSRSVHIADVTAEPAYIERDPASSPSSNSLALGPCSSCRCSRRTSWSAPSSSTARRCARSPTSRSSWSRASPARPSSPSRTPGCSRSCATRSASRCSSRPPPPTCSRSSAARPFDLQPVFRPRWQNRRRGSARPTMACLFQRRGRCLSGASWRCTDVLAPIKDDVSARPGRSRGASMRLGARCRSSGQSRPHPRCAG